MEIEILEAIKLLGVGLEQCLKNLEEIKNHLPRKQKEYLLNEEVEIKFNLTKSIRQKLVRQGRLTPIKLTGSKSNVMWSRSEIENIFNKKFKSNETKI